MARSLFTLILLGAAAAAAGAPGLAHAGTRAYGSLAPVDVQGETPLIRSSAGESLIPTGSDLCRIPPERDLADRGSAAPGTSARAAVPPRDGCYQGRPRRSTSARQHEYSPYLPTGPPS
jgi:hypothetical protein